MVYAYAVTDEFCVRGTFLGISIKTFNFRMKVGQAKHGLGHLWFIISFFLFVNVVLSV